MGNNCCIRSDWKCKTDPSSAARWQEAVYSAPNCSPQGTTLFYWNRTAWSRLRALWLTTSTGVVYMIHFYILVGQDNDCTFAETTFLWDPYAFHTCSKNTINTRTIVLYITQFGLEIQILVSYPRNKIDFFNPNQNSKHPFYWWAGNELTFLLLIYFQSPLSPYGVCGFYASYRFSLLYGIIKRLKENSI